ncbi:MAG: hypothetical protein V4659_03870 [Pseudomonadota bacterium]
MGWDYGAAFVTAQALGINPLAVAEFLPWIEAEMVKARAADRRARDGEGDDDGQDTTMIGQGGDDGR